MVTPTLILSSRQIQRWALHITSEPELTGRLSPAEKDFARELVSARIGHLQVGQAGSPSSSLRLPRPWCCLVQASVLVHMPAEYRLLVGAEGGVLDGPPLGTHVAAIPLEDLGEVLLGGGGAGEEPMDMPAGQAKILPYAAVRELVLAGRVKLV